MAGTHQRESAAQCVEASPLFNSSFSDLINIYIRSVDPPPLSSSHRFITFCWRKTSVPAGKRVYQSQRSSGSKLGQHLLQVKKGEKLWIEPEPEPPAACNDAPCVQQTDATAPQHLVLAPIGPILDVSGGTLRPAAGGEVRLIRSGPDVEHLSPRDPSSGTSCSPRRLQTLSQRRPQPTQTEVRGRRMNNTSTPPPSFWKYEETSSSGS
ncbi:uncharacterized protein LOC103464360 [Poecilia reticulata]|uniref:uncharacterized protein LOC103464360 n=1 Tax=Poecilia reticulata TaxID=8081 RepID=UPI0004A47A5E|nr:PREDICTED: uncharacterized protein LOC103464360 [Poecilia reticulata]